MSPKVSPTEFSGVYFQVNWYRIATQILLIYQENFEVHDSWLHFAWTKHKFLLRRECTFPSLDLGLQTIVCEKTALTVPTKSRLLAGLTKSGKIFTLSDTSNSIYSKKHILWQWLEECAFKWAISVWRLLCLECNAENQFRFQTLRVLGYIV